MTMRKPDLTGKTCIVTGPTAGIGFETAAALAGMGADLVLACRDAARGEDARRRIVARGAMGRLEVMELDLASQRNIRAFAGAFLSRFERLDVLVNNAGLIPLRRKTTTDGFEMQFGVNYLGPFALTLLLIDAMKASPGSRVVNVSSVIHRRAVILFDDLQSETQYGTLKAYGQSKLGNVMFTYALARRLEGSGVRANCLHPGVVRSQITRDLPRVLHPMAKVGSLFLTSPARGARTSVHLAASPDVAGVSGQYFVKCKPARSSERSHDVDAQERLWGISAEMTGIDY